MECRDMAHLTPAPEPGRRPRLPENPAWAAQWQDNAACAGTDGEVFFAKQRGQEKDIATAKAICADCPVRRQCLDHARSLPETFGIWGGMTAYERGWDGFGKRRRPELRPQPEPDGHHRPFTDSPSGRHGAAPRGRDSERASGTREPPAG
ncbi:WhiB family transcriptional regulator [Streptomyces gamaensis]|uniref:Transcriptional regulator WhiB n=1 Tax=Streptomyces gamaensis TaxID=1763542 RepID=A0ABW0Z956_9ACTN